MFKQNHLFHARCASLSFNRARFVDDKDRNLYSNDDGMLSFAILTLTQVTGIIPRQDVFQVDMNTVLTPTNAIRTSLDAEYLRTWLHKTIIRTDILLYVNAEGKLDASDTSLLHLQGIQPHITTIPNSVTVLNLSANSINTDLGNGAIACSRKHISSIRCKLS